MSDSALVLAARAADSLSFLDTNVGLFLGFVRSGRITAQEVRWKFRHSYDRIHVPAAKSLGLPLFEQACEQLAGLEMSMSGSR